METMKSDFQNPFDPHDERCFSWFMPSLIVGESEWRDSSDRIAHPSASPRSPSHILDKATGIESVQQFHGQRRLWHWFSFSLAVICRVFSRILQCHPGWHSAPTEESWFSSSRLSVVPIHTRGHGEDCLFIVQPVQSDDHWGSCWKGEWFVATEGGEAGITERLQTNPCFYWPVVWSLVKHSAEGESDSIDALERRASVRKAICGIKSRSSEDDEMNSLLKERGSVRNALHMADEYLGFLPSVWSDA